MWVQSLGQENPLEEEVAAHSRILVWRIPMDRGALAGCSPWGRKELDTTAHMHTHTHTLLTQAVGLSILKDV